MHLYDWITTDEFVEVIELAGASLDLEEALISPGGVPGVSSGPEFGATRDAPSDNFNGVVADQEW